MRERERGGARAIAMAMAMAMAEEGSEREDESEKREIGKLAVWSVSSAKPGNGVDLLRDSNLETYWQ